MLWNMFWIFVWDPFLSTSFRKPKDHLWVAFCSGSLVLLRGGISNLFIKQLHELTCPPQNWFSVLHSQASGLRTAYAQYCHQWHHAAPVTKAGMLAWWMLACMSELLLQPCISIRASTVIWLVFLEIWMEMLRWAVHPASRTIVEQCLTLTE